MLLPTELQAQPAVPWATWPGQLQRHGGVGLLAGCREENVWPSSNWHCAVLAAPGADRCRRASAAAAAALAAWMLPIRRKRRTLGLPVAAVTSSSEASPSFANDVRTIVAFAVPAMTIGILTPLLDAIDAVVVGQFGSTVDLAALNPPISACYNIQLLFSFLSTATAFSLAKERGRWDLSAARGFLRDACFLAVCCGAAAGTLLLAFHGSVLELLVSPAALAEIRAPASGYLCVRALGLPAQMLQLVLASACFSALQDPMSPLRAALAAAATNLALDLVLVAKCGLGCVGAALATVVGQLAAVAVLYSALRRNRGFAASGAAQDLSGGAAADDALPLLLSPSEWLRSVRPRQALKVLAFAAPFLSFQLTKVALQAIETRMGSAFGPNSLAAHQVGIALWRFLVWLCFPFVNVAQALVTAPFAEGTAAGFARARQLASAMLAAAVVLGAASGVLGLVLCAGAPSLFTRDAAVAGEAARLAVPLALSVVVLSVWHCNEGLMLASGRARLLSGLYLWNIGFALAGSRLVLWHQLQLVHWWYVFASVHGSFAVLVSVVLRLPGGVFRPRLGTAT